MTDASTAAEPVPQSRVFGLRGWPATIAISVFYMFLFVLVGAIFLTDEPIKAGLETARQWPGRLAILVIALLMARRARIGMQRSNQVPRLSLWMLLPLGLMMLGAVLCLFGGVSAPNMILAVIVTDICVGAAEEIFFRGLILNLLAQTRSNAAAVVGSTVAFAAAHILGGPQAVAVPLFLGLGLGWLYVLSGRNLWLVIVVHTLFDLAQGLLAATTESAQLFVVAGGVLTVVGGLVLTGIGMTRQRRERLAHA